ncbi:uncharacterized protein LOC125297971 isoform X1 [Alosa alosa]|uniref:uncharacterized protein LOC125297971 isoform X1 n=1 Tax=Alosa alosa TaxID=278164 RepID=UPI00201541E1|nr:uncharacterized protein LOC125297971 isoform X1 [Alosa alosa]
MNFQYNFSNNTQDDFHQDQGVQHILSNQAGVTYFHGVAPTTRFGVINQPVIWPEYHSYQPQQNHGLLGNSTALPQFLPVTEIPVLHPIPPPWEGYHGMTLQDGVAFDPRLQGPVMFVDPRGQQHGTSVNFHPQLQAPLVAVGGVGPEYGVPVPYAPHVQTPIMYVDANGQQHGTTVPFDSQLQAPFMLVDRGGLPHGTSMLSDEYLQAPLMPMDATDLQHRTAMLFNLVPAPIEPVELIDNPQLPSIEQLAAGPSSTGLMTPALMVKIPAPKKTTEVAMCAPSGVTTESLNPQATTSTVVAEAMQVQAGQSKAKIKPQQPGTSSSRESLVVKLKSQDDTKKQQLHGVMMDADKNVFKQALKADHVETGKAEANLPKTPKSSHPENADRHKDKNRKHKHDKGGKERKEKRHKNATSPTEKTNKSGDGEKEGPDTNKKIDSSKMPEDKSKAKHKDQSKSKKAKETPINMQPRSKLGERIMHSVQVFYKLGDKIEKVKPPKPKPEAAKKSQSERPSSSGGQRGQPKIPYPVQSYRIPKVQSPSNAPERPGPSNVPDWASVRSHADQSRRPEHSQSRPSAPEIRVQRLPAPARQRHRYEVPHFFKNHAYGSVGDYGDGERIVYLKPEYRGMFPITLVNLPPLPPGAPRRFHCREYSVTITAERRAEKEAMKREAKRERDEAAKITRSNMDCSVLADRKHLPHEPWPRKDNWWETGLDEVWKFDECLLGPRDDLMFD